MLSHGDMQLMTGGQGDGAVHLHEYMNVGGNVDIAQVVPVSTSNAELRLPGTTVVTHIQDMTQQQQGFEGMRGTAMHGNASMTLSSAE